jgi:hypothetical protein
VPQHEAANSLAALPRDVREQLLALAAPAKAAAGDRSRQRFEGAVRGVAPLLPRRYARAAASLQAMAATGELPALVAYLSEARLEAALLCLLTGEPARQAGHCFGLTGSSVAHAKRLLPPNLKSQLRQLAAEVAAAEAAAVMEAAAAAAGAARPSSTTAEAT